MARPIRIQIKQLRELQAALKRGEGALEPAVVSRIIANALDLIRQGALRNVQMNFKMHTGNLAKSLITHLSRTNLQGRFGAWVKAGGKQIAPHAHLLEFGHDIWKGGRKKHGIGHSAGHVEGKPFFRPAVDENRAQVRKQIRQNLTKELEKGFGFGKPGSDSD